jgi:2,5-diketo-D-gluconate reductase B
MKNKMIKGVSVPSIGLGTFELTGPDGARAIRTAIDAGYRHIDTAIRYGNETEVGQAIRDSGIDRDELFVTTKIWYDNLAPENVDSRTAESLERLQLDHVDLLLVHWPSRDIALGETLAAFAEQRAKGRTRLIGVSNFTTALLDEATRVHGADLFANQVEYHPFLAQPKVMKAVRDNAMLMTAYLPLARGAVFQSDLLREIGERYGKSPGQVALRWLIQQDGVAAIPRSSRIENIKANLDVFDFELKPDEMVRIAGLDEHRRLCDFHWSPAWDPA